MIISCLTIFGKAPCGAARVAAKLSCGIYNGRSHLRIISWNVCKMIIMMYAVDVPLLWRKLSVNASPLKINGTTLRITNVIVNTIKLDRRT